MQKVVSAYMQANVSTTTPGELLLLLYDGGINFLNQAKRLIGERDYAGKGIAISKAMDVLNELSSSLNREKGGELAANLNKLYFWCNSRLAMANLKMNTEMIDEVIKVLSGLRGAYAQIQNLPEAQAASAQIQAGNNSDHAISRNLAAIKTTARNTLPPASNQRVQAAYSKMAGNGL
ncbi:MAG: flagellar export chaperone FliS [Deltaproteobacteria bacterium]|jgi:flagellar protein FliS|nr:flagellar export chaperone FliS [Deltaproteobacteria bacterium]